MSEINLEFIDRSEEWDNARNLLKFMKDWASLIDDSSAYYDKIRDSSVHYFEPLYDIDILDSSHISLTFKYDYELIENE